MFNRSTTAWFKIFIAQSNVVAFYFSDAVSFSNSFFFTPNSYVQPG